MSLIEVSKMLLTCIYEVVSRSCPYRIPTCHSRTPFISDAVYLYPSKCLRRCFYRHNCSPLSSTLQHIKWKPVHMYLPFHSSIIDFLWPFFLLWWCLYRNKRNAKSSPVFRFFFLFFFCQHVLLNVVKYSRRLSYICCTTIQRANRNRIVLDQPPWLIRLYAAWSFKRSETYEHICFWKDFLLLIRIIVNLTVWRSYCHSTSELFSFY